MKRGASFFGESEVSKRRMSPYKSKKQQRWAHSPAGIKALGGKGKVAEWDAASRGKSLPERVKAKKRGRGK